MLLRLLVVLAVALFASGCAAPTIDEEAGRGGGSPEQVVESFVESLNLALRDPSLADPNVRRGWAERLASYFAPSERTDQRTVLAGMLARFATTSAQPVVGARAIVEVTYLRTEVVSQDETNAEVRLVEGTLNVRWLNETGEVVRERSGNLMDLIGGGRRGLPVLRVGNQWFMTEG